MEVISAHGEVGGALLEQGSAVVKAVAERLLNGCLVKEDSVQIANSLVTLRSATNYLEGTARFEEAHKALDYAGRVQRVAFPRNCALKETNGAYSQQCPVALAHNRIGVSIGAIIDESACSICDQDPDLCLHVSGREYDGSRCHRIITKFRADHMSFVERPDFPDARFTAVPVDLVDIISVFGTIPAPGTSVFCNRCLHSCAGVRRPFQTLN